jgi:hypothetical protein
MNTVLIIPDVLDTIPVGFLPELKLSISLSVSSSRTVEKIDALYSIGINASCCCNDEGSRSRYCCGHLDGVLLDHSRRYHHNLPDFLVAYTLHRPSRCKS